MTQTPLTLQSRQMRREHTHTRIKNTLLRLMSQKPYESITVTELARETGINRKTFYSHFESIDAVLAELEDDFVGQVFALWLTGQSAGGREFLHEFFCMLTDRLMFSQQDLRLLVLSGEYNRLLVKIKDRIIQLLVQSLDQVPSPSVDQKEFRFVAEFISGGIMGALGLWASEPDETSLATVTGLIRQMTDQISLLLTRPSASL